MWFADSDISYKFCDYLIMYIRRSEIMENELELKIIGLLLIDMYEEGQNETK